MDERERDLHRQHEDWLRQRYDGHGRRPAHGRDIGQLRVRKKRRWLNEGLRQLARGWEPSRTGRARR